MKATSEQLGTAAHSGAQGLQARAAADGDNNYSPYSNPFGDRPPLRTSAGYAVRQSSSDLPSPAAFTPVGVSSAGNASTGNSPPPGVLRPWDPQLQHMEQPQQWQQQQPWMPQTPTSTFGHSAASAGGSNSILGADTPVGPGFDSPVESRLADQWEGAGSSTKPPAGGVFEFQLGQGASRHLASPDLRFAGSEARKTGKAARAGSTVPSPQDSHSTSPAAQQSPSTAPDTTDQGQQHSQTSDQKLVESGAAAPANSQASGDSMASRSSAASRERLAAMHSPSQVLKQAAKIMRSRAAVGGSSHIPLQRKQPALVTPMHRTSQAPATPNPTPATPLPEGSDATKGPDQADSDTPEGGRMAVDQLTPPVYKGIRTPVQAQVASPGADSAAGSIVSFGSHCNADVADLVDSLIDAVPTTPRRDAAHSTPAGSPGTPGSTTAPQPLDQLAAGLEDSATRRRAQRIFFQGSPGSELSGLGDMSGAEDVQPIILDFLGDAEEADGGNDGGSADVLTPPRALLQLKRLVPLMLLLLVAGCTFGALLGASVLPGWLPPVPGAICNAHNASVCQGMYAAAFKHGGDELVEGWHGKVQLAILRTKWHAQDAWEYMVHGRMPREGPEALDAVTASQAGAAQQEEAEAGSDEAAIRANATAGGVAPAGEQAVPVGEAMEGQGLNGMVEVEAPASGTSPELNNTVNEQEHDAAADAPAPSMVSEHVATLGEQEADAVVEAPAGLTPAQVAEFEAAMLALADLADQAGAAFMPLKEQASQEQASASGADEVPAAAPAETVIQPGAKTAPQKLQGTCPSWLGLTERGTCFKDCWPAQHLQHKLVQSDAGFGAYDGPGVCYPITLSPVAVCDNPGPVFHAPSVKAPELVPPSKSSTVSTIFQVLKWVSFVAAAVGTGVAAVTNADYLSQVWHNGMAAATRALAAYRAPAVQEAEEQQQQQQQQEEHADAGEVLLSGDEAEGRRRRAGAARGKGSAATPGAKSRIMRVIQSPAALHAAAALPLSPAPADDALLSDEEPTANRRSQATRRRSSAAAAAAAAAGGAATAAAGPPARSRRASASQQAAAEAAAEAQEAAVSGKAPAASGKAASGRGAASGGNGAAADDAEVVSPRAGGRGRRSTAGRLTVVAEERAAAAQEQEEADDEAAPTPSTATGRARRTAATRRSSVPAVAVPEDVDEVDQALASPTRRSGRASKGARASRG